MVMHATLHGSSAERMDMHERRPSKAMESA
jgi:hypothetical protein